jgi:hypothetical protein
MELTEDLKQEICSMFLKPLKLSHWFLIKDLGFDKYLPADFFLNFESLYNIEKCMYTDLEYYKNLNDRLECEIEDLRHEQSNIIEIKDSEIDRLKAKIDRMIIDYEQQ